MPLLVEMKGDNLAHLLLLFGEARNQGWINRLCRHFFFNRDD